MNLIAEAIKGYWGERCPDHHAECPTCKAWGEYDEMVMTVRDANEKEV